MNQPPKVLIIVAVYWMLFLFGTAGNFSMLSNLLRLSRRKTRRRCRAAVGDANLDYLIALCLSDGVTLLCIPVIITDLMADGWPFGSILCKIHWYMEPIGKLFSIFVLVAMTLQRYFKACHPHKTVKCSVSKISTWHILAALALGTSALISPFPYHAQVENIQHVDANGTMLGEAIYKCVVESMGSTNTQVFTWILFSVGHVIPTVLILFFSAMLLGQLRYRQHQSVISSKIPMCRVTIYTIIIAAFYGVCWVPFWIAILQISGVKHEESDRMRPNAKESESQILLMYAIHALPMLSAATNWIFYGLMNRQFQRMRKMLATKPGYRRIPGKNLTRHSTRPSGNHLYVPRGSNPNSNPNQKGSSSDSDMSPNSTRSSMTFCNSNNASRTPSPVEMDQLTTVPKQPCTTATEIDSP